MPGVKLGLYLCGGHAAHREDRDSVPLIYLHQFRAAGANEPIVQQQYGAIDPKMNCFSMLIVRFNGSFVCCLRTFDFMD